MVNISRINLCNKYLFDHLIKKNLSFYFHTFVRTKIDYFPLKSTNFYIKLSSLFVVTKTRLVEGMSTAKTHNPRVTQTQSNSTSHPIYATHQNFCNTNPNKKRTKQ